MYSEREKYYALGSFTSLCNLILYLILRSSAALYRLSGLQSPLKGHVSTSAELKMKHSHSFSTHPEHRKPSVCSLQDIGFG
jgi:hypothetical protein